MPPKPPVHKQKRDQKTMKTWFIVFMMSTLSVPLTYAASFDCNKAAQSVEKAICTDTQLGKLDETLNDNYKHVTASNIGDSARKDLKTDQRAWLVLRNKCTNRECLVQLYKKRIDDICDFTVLSGAAPPCKTSEEE
jgi:uncharacterized protein